MFYLLVGPLTQLYHLCLLMSWELDLIDSHPANLIHWLPLEDYNRLQITLFIDYIVSGEFDVISENKI